MCGFSGVVSGYKPIPIQKLEKSLASLYNRGPDQLNILLSENFGFTHARLAIRDSARGSQPYFEDESNFVLLFNGEIFNVDFLTELLKKNGIQCVTSCDTELVYKIYSLFGNLSFGLFDGQFAIAIYDLDRKDLILARDVYGEKPLYFCSEKDAIYFGSTIYSISALLDHGLSFLEESVVSSALFWGDIPYQTNFKNIESIIPGTYSVFTNYKFQFRSSFNMINPEIEADGNINSIAFDEVMDQSVRERLVSDAEVGVYLSGGVDSSAIAHYVQKNCQNKVIKSFGISFDDTVYDESTRQSLVSKHLSTSHLFSDGDQTSDSYLNIGIMESEACSHRMSFAAFYGLSELAKNNNIKVALTGEGADELLYGYDHFREHLLAQAGGSLSDSQIKSALSTINNFIPSTIDSAKYLKYKYLEIKASSQMPVIDFILKSRVPILNVLRPLLKIDLSSQIDVIKNQWKNYMEYRYPGFNEVKMSDKLSHQWRRAFDIETLLSGHLLRDQGDRASMYNSLETRAPFLSKELFLKIQNSYRFELHSGEFYEEKRLLKEAVADYLPKEILFRKKFPFRSPEIKNARYLKNNISILDKRIFNVSEIENYIDRVLEGRLINPSISAAVIGLILSFNLLANGKLNKDILNLININESEIYFEKSKVVAKLMTYKKC